MIALAIKLALAAFAFLVAFLGVSDLKTVRPDETPAPKPWYRRITPIGTVKILCAVITLALVGANEWITYRDSADNAQKTAAASKDSSEEAKRLQTKVDEAKKAVGANIIQLGSLATTNRHLVTTLDSALVVAGNARVPSEGIDSTEFPLSFEGGGKLIPKKGDVFEWSMVCQSGRLPNIPLVQENASCSQAGYGRLIADGYPILLNDTSGRRTFFGTRSTGDTMSYRSPSEGGWCPSIGARLKELNCQLEIAVMRQARWKFENLERESGGRGAIADANALDDACRRYEALFGDSCETLVGKASQK